MIEEIIFLNYYMERLQLELWYRQIFPVQEGFKETKDDGKKISCCGLRVAGLPASKAKLNLNIKVSCSRSVKLAEEDGLPGS